jgi:DNA-directed RNA polymerase specialized sigma subunit
MATIKYKMADGRVEEIEVTDEFAAKYAEFEQEEQRREWREEKRRKREVSLDGLAASGKEIADPINRDPLELLIEREEPDLPLFTGLTEYQRRVAAKFFVEHKTHRQIAREEGVSHQTITRLIGKIQEKVIGTFD